MHPLLEHLCKQLGDRLKKRRVVLFYDLRREFEPFIDELVPETGPGAAKDARARLHEALTAFEIAADASAREGDTIHSVVFGRVSLADYIVFQELHVRHHRTQLPEAAVG